MKRALLGLLAACTTLGLASVVLAGENANAGISLHITQPTAKATTCASFSYATNPASPFETRGKPCKHGVGNFDVWVVVCNGSDSVGLAGAEFGIDYDGALGSGVDIVGWNSCSDLEFPQDDWPLAGSGNLVTWADCQTTNLFGPKTAYAVAGVFSVQSYGSDELAITPRPVSASLKVADCAAVEDDITGAAVSRKGIVTFCTGHRGYNFCSSGSLAGGQTTWGNLKTIYGNND